VNLDADILVQVAITVGIFLLVGFPVHEFFHAFAAYRLGDNTARYMGRLTLDPRRHFDPIGGSMLAISAFLSQGSFAFGFAKPTPVNPINLDGGRRGEAIVAAAGPLSNLVMAGVASIVLRVVASLDGFPFSLMANPVTALLWNIGFLFVVFNVVLFLFNLLPIPPLDGWRVLLGLVPPRTAFTLRSYEQYAMFALIIIVIFGGRIIGPVIGVALDFLLGDAQGLLPLRR
jgi:Zn-dependent protease